MNKDYLEKMLLNTFLYALSETDNDGIRACKMFKDKVYSENWCNYYNEDNEGKKLIELYIIALVQIYGE